MVMKRMLERQVGKTDGDGGLEDSDGYDLANTGN